MNAKRIIGLVFLLIILSFSAFAGDRGVPVYQSGKTLGGTRTYGIDPCGAQVFVYTKYASSMTQIEMISVGEVCRDLYNNYNPGFWIMDVGSHIEENIPPGDPLFLVVFLETDSGTPERRGYYSFSSIIRNPEYGANPDNPEPFPDVTLSPIPVPTVNVSKENYVQLSWDPVMINDPQAPFEVYYNVFRSNNTMEIGKKINQEHITGTNYIDNDPELEPGVPYFYSIQLTTQHGIVSGKWLPGPDGFPGIKGVDDDGNGIIDDAPELGSKYSDDVFVNIVSRPSTPAFVQDSIPPDPPKDLSALASDSAVYLTWTAPAEPNDIAGYYIYRDDVGLLDTINKTTIYSDSNNVKNGTMYEYLSLIHI